MNMNMNMKEEMATVTLKVTMGLEKTMTAINAEARRMNVTAGEEYRGNIVHWSKRIGEDVRPLIEKMAEGQNVDWDEMDQMLEWIEGNKESLKKELERVCPRPMNGWVKDVMKYYYVAMSAMWGGNAMEDVVDVKTRVSANIMRQLEGTNTTKELLYILNSEFEFDLVNWTPVRDMVRDIMVDIMWTVMTVGRYREKARTLLPDVLTAIDTMTDHVMEVGSAGEEKQTSETAADSEEDTECWSLVDSDSDSDSDDDDVCCVPPPTPAEEIVISDDDAPEMISLDTDNSSSDDNADVRDLRRILRDEFSLDDGPGSQLPPPSPPTSPVRRTSSRRLPPSPVRRSSRRLSLPEDISCDRLFCNIPSHRNFHYSQ